MRKKAAGLQALLFAACVVLTAGCGKKELEYKQPETEQIENVQTEATEISVKPQVSTETEAMPEETETEQQNMEAMAVSEPQQEEPVQQEEQAQPETVETPPPAQITTSQNAGTGITYPSSNGHTVCIDPGHQAQGDSTPEPVAPGASETKARVSSGTTGRTTGVPEYQLTLQVSLKLRDELIARGYGVVMTRETNEVNISNSERAQIAVNGGADTFIRIHANGSEDSSVNGAMTICQTAGNPYVSGYYDQSKSLSQNVLDNFCAATGAGKHYVWETDTMSGINWSQMPVTILEMGYMTNPTEDTNMSTEDYQNRMVQGIANGIDAYYAGQ